MPKDVHVDPQKFAAELISKLEGVLREREAQEKLEERLRRVRLVGEPRLTLPLARMRLLSVRLCVFLLAYSAVQKKTMFK